MNKLDRRFINVSLVVEGIANAPAANPTTGMQYIVGTAGTGAFKDKAANTIAKYNGTSWDFTAPDVYGMEVINKETSSILKWNGTEWIVSVSFTDSGETNSFVVEGMENEPAANPTVGVQYIVGSSGKGAFAGKAKNSIARYNGTNWDFITPPVGTIVLVFSQDGNRYQNTANLYRWDGEDWDNVYEFYTLSSGYSSALRRFSITIPADKAGQVTSFDLTENSNLCIDPRMAEYGLIFLNGVLVGEDIASLVAGDPVGYDGMGAVNINTDTLKIGDKLDVVAYCYNFG